MPFNDDQVEKYVNKWFPIGFPGTKAQREQRARDFLSESAIIPDIRQNPLMLALLCNLYRQDGYIPRYSPDVYQKCAELLFEKWDKGRQIIASIPIVYHLRPIMCHLAHWIYCDNALQAGVTETALIDETSEYLRDFFEEAPKARDYASQVVEFFRGRAWVFSDTGSTESERLYQFTHRTFLEFFTSDYLVGSAESAANLGSILLPHIAVREWDMVCTLAYQMQAKRKKQAADELLSGALTFAEATSDSKQRLNLILFATKLLNLIHPTLTIRKAVVLHCIDALVADSEQREDRVYELEDRGIEELAKSILEMSDESGRPMASIVLPHLEEIGLSSYERRAAAAMETLCLIKSSFSNDLSEDSEQHLAANAWMAPLAEVFLRVKERMIGLAKSNRALALCLWWDNIIDLEALLDWHDHQILFRQSQVGFGPSHFVSIIDYVMWNFFSRKEASKISAEGTKSIAKKLLQAPLPWGGAALLRGHLPFRHISDAGEGPRWPDDIYERSVVSLATAAFGPGRSIKVTNPYSILQQLCAKREDGLSRDQAFVLIRQLSVPGDVEELLVLWATRDIELLGPDAVVDLRSVSEDADAETSWDQDQVL